VERFRDDALAAIAGVTWIPAVGQKRITQTTRYLTVSLALLEELMATASIIGRA
jgi:hypothetical protein